MKTVKTTLPPTESTPKPPINWDEVGDDGLTADERLRRAVALVAKWAFAPDTPKGQSENG